MFVSIPSAARGGIVLEYSKGWYCENDPSRPFPSFASGSLGLFNSTGSFGSVLLLETTTEGSIDSNGMRLGCTREISAV